MSEIKTGFNWLAFFFNSTYYSGKGNLKKGFLLASFAWFPLFMIPIAIYSGVKANKEIENDNFNWMYAIGTGVFQVVFGLVIVSILKK